MTPDQISRIKRVAYSARRGDTLDRSYPPGVAAPIRDAIVRVCSIHRHAILHVDPSGDAMWCDAGHRPRAWLVVRRADGHILAAGRHRYRAPELATWLPDGAPVRDLLDQALGAHYTDRVKSDTFPEVYENRTPFRPPTHATFRNTAESEA